VCANGKITKNRTDPSFATACVHGSKINRHLVKITAFREIGDFLKISTNLISLALTTNKSVVVVGCQCQRDDAPHLLLSGAGAPAPAARRASSCTAQIGTHSAPAAID